MAGSTFGEIFRVTTWGESHGEALGAVIDGCPAGLELSEEDIRPYLERRATGKDGTVSSQRKESDKCRILSGVFNGFTTGTPISVIIENEDRDDTGYDPDLYRPGHADRTYEDKYGLRDWRGGGRASGRETAGRVIAGAIAAKLLDKLGIRVSAFVQSIGEVPVEEGNDAYLRQYLSEIKKAGESIGGVVTCVITGCPAGLGEPVFDKLDAELAKAVMSIGAVKGVEIGAGFMSASMLGSQCNDPDDMNAGGILGGISNGKPIIISAAVKPTPTRGSERHDVCIAPRAAVVIEAMAAITILDMYYRNKNSRV
ncbi:MAG: chorismate synthase [Lachnospiraceae bacterium]|nr:chorismate synthase [Lachnospiraceae bacterium]